MGLADLVLSLADNKQLLGLRYAEWAIRAPTLEADIAAAAMGLDDLGHSRVLQGCLEPLGSDPRGPERESDPASYRSAAYFDQPWTQWAQFVAANAILDTAFSVTLQACLEGSSEVLQQRLRKMLMEERYHFLHGRSWLAEGVEGDWTDLAWKEAIEFFGPEGGELDSLAAEGLIAAGPAELLSRLEARLEADAPAVTVEWGDWDPLRRRTGAGALDARTFAMLRGLEERRFAPGGSDREP